MTTRESDASLARTFTPRVMNLLTLFPGLVFRGSQPSWWPRPLLPFPYLVFCVFFNTSYQPGGCGVKLLECWTKIAKLDLFSDKPERVGWPPYLCQLSLDKILKPSHTWCYWNTDIPKGSGQLSESEPLEKTTLLRTMLKATVNIPSLSIICSHTHTYTYHHHHHPEGKQCSGWWRENEYGNENDCTLS